MKLATSRRRLLAGAALGFGLATLAPQQAQAACAITTTTNPGDTYLCADTTTTDTTGLSGTDRNVEYTTDTIPLLVEVPAGVTVDGYGMAFTDIGTGTNALTFTNDGVVQIDVGNTATAGGNGSALYISSVNAPVIYGGTGDVINLGTAGNGLQIDVTGTGSASVVFEGNAVSAAGGDETSGNAIFVNHTGSAGDIDLTTTVGSTATADYVGVWARMFGDPTATGNITLTNNATVSGLTANGLNFGVAVEQFGLGSATLVNNGTIGSSTDRITQTGVYAEINNIASTADLNVSGTGAIFSSGTGLLAGNNGAGDIIVNYTGAIDSTGDGVVINASGGGDVDATLGDVTGGDFGVEVNVSGGGSFTGSSAGNLSGGTSEGIQITVLDAGSIDFTSTGSISSATDNAISAFINSAIGGDITLSLNDVTSDPTAAAVNAFSSSDTGNVTITTDGTVTGGGGVSTALTSATATGDISVTSNGDIAAEVIGISAFNAGSGDVTVLAVGPITANTSDGVTASTSGGNITIETGDVTAGAEGIVATQTDAAGAGAISVTTNGVITAATTAIDIDNAGTGAVDVDVVGSIAADAGDAVQVTSTNAAAGAIGITTTAGETLAVSGGDGIEVDTAGTGNVGIINAADIVSGAGGVNTLVDGINVTSTGTGDITINNSGAIGDVGDRAQGFGISATINNAASAGDISIAGTGPIFSVSSGINAVTNGTGTVGVVYGGDIDTTAGSGIYAESTTGALTVVAGGTITTTGGDGIATLTTTGAQTITVNGAIDANAGGVSGNSISGAITANINGDIVAGANGVTLSSSGDKVVNVGAGGSIDSTGLNDIVFNGGGLGTVNNSGTIGATDTGTAIATGTATVDINNNAGGIINGVVTLSAGNDTFDNAGTWNTAGLNDFGAGTDVLNNNSGGVVNVLAGASFGGLETLSNAGTINAASGLLFDGGDTLFTNTGTFNLAGALDMGAGTDTFANTGTGIFNLTANASLVGVDTLTQTGRINLNTFTLTGSGAFTNGAGGVIDTSGSAGLAGFTSLNNAGTIDLAPGTFTVPAVVFTNSGTILADEGASTITGQTSFANSGTIDLQDGATGDVLTINSAFAGSGSSSLLVDFSGSVSDRLVINGAASGATTVGAAYLGGGFNLDGVLVVDSVSSTANAFTLGAVTGETPLLDVSMVQSGADYFLVAAPTQSAFDPLVVPGFATDLWYQSADEIFAETVKPATTTGISFWGEGYYSREKYGDDDRSVSIDGVDFAVDNELKTTRYGLQLGVDYGFGGGRVGLSGGYGRAKANGNLGADLKAKGWNLGVYGQFGGLTGFHGEFLAKHDRYDAEFDDGAFDGQEFDIRATGIDGSLGYRFGMGGAATVDLHAGVSHVRTKVDDINAYGFTYDIAKLTSTRGRAGVRAILGGSMAPYVDATVYHEFKGNGDVELFDGANRWNLDTRGKGTWVRLEAGLSGNDGPGPILAAYGDLGDRKGFGLRAGWRLGGQAVAMPPPPPPPPPPLPPPPPPPPATQTCPDGSVILATDSCPLPPPPPPPPPPEPERG